MYVCLGECVFGRMCVREKMYVCTRMCVYVKENV